MDNHLYKQQMDRMRPIDHSEFTGWEETKLFGGAVLALILLVGSFVGISFAVAGLFG